MKPGYNENCAEMKKMHTEETEADKLKVSETESIDAALNA